MYTIGSRLLLIAVACYGAFAHADDFTKARNIISLDYCADQYALKLLAAPRILALSPDSICDFSYLREAAIPHRKVRPIAEDVILLKPDLVIRTYGGGPNANHFFRRMGVPVLQIGYADTIAAIKSTIITVSTQLGVAGQGKNIVREMDARLAKIKPAPAQQTLYVTPGGVTGGPGTLVDDLIRAAGLSNYQTASGWRNLPLEQLAYQQPELLATAFYRTTIYQSHLWSAARHPIIRRQIASPSGISLDGATLACGGWFLVDAVETLATAGSMMGGKN